MRHERERERELASAHEALHPFREKKKKFFPRPVMCLAWGIGLRARGDPNVGALFEQYDLECELAEAGRDRPNQAP